MTAAGAKKARKRSRNGRITKANNRTGKTARAVSRSRSQAGQAAERPHGRAALCLLLAAVLCPEGRRVPLPVAECVRCWAVHTALCRLRPRIRCVPRLHKAHLGAILESAAGNPYGGCIHVHRALVDERRLPQPIPRITGASGTVIAEPFLVQMCQQLVFPPLLRPENGHYLQPRARDSGFVQPVRAQQEIRRASYLYGG